MSGRQTRRQLRNVKDDDCLKTTNPPKAQPFTLSPSQSTRSAVRAKSPKKNAGKCTQILLIGDRPVLSINKGRDVFQEKTSVTHFKERSQVKDTVKWKSPVTSTNKIEQNPITGATKWEHPVTRTNKQKQSPVTVDIKMKSPVTSSNKQKQSLLTSTISGAEVGSREQCPVSVSNERTESASRKESPLTSFHAKAEVIARQADTRISQKDDGKSNIKSVTSVQSAKINNDMCDGRSKQEGQSGSLEFDHYKSKDKSFTSASHVKVVRSLSGETETGKKIYSVSVTEAKTSPKISPGTGKCIKKTSVCQMSKPEPVTAQSPPFKVCSQPLQSLERIEFDDGIVFEIGEEFGDLNTSQESFDSCYSSQGVNSSQKSSQEGEMLMSQESGVSLPSYQQRGISLTSVDPYSDAEDYLDGKIHSLPTAAKFNKQDHHTTEEECKPSVPYPSDQSQFFGMFGLVKKSDVPKDDPSKNKLHRSVGGKLRRTVKPNIKSEMVYTRLTKSSLFEDGQGEDMEEEEEEVEEKCSKTNAPKILSRSTLLQQEQVKMHKSAGIAHQYKLHIGKVPLVSIERDTDLSNTAQSTERSSFTESPGKHKERRKVNELSKGTIPVKKTRLEHPCGASETYLQTSHRSTLSTATGRTKQTNTKRKVVQSREKVRPMKASITSGGKTYELGEVHIKEEPVDSYTANAMNETEDLDATNQSRRSGRNAKRKEWKHLLKANPDVYEQESEFEKQLQFVPKHYRVQANKLKMKQAVAKSDRVEIGALPASPERCSVMTRSPEKQYMSPRKKRKDKNKRRKDFERITQEKFDAVKSSESYLDLYEEVVEKQGSNSLRLRRRKDWALAKMMLTKAEAMKRARTIDPNKWEDMSSAIDPDDVETASCLLGKKKGHSTMKKTTDTESNDDYQIPDGVENTKDLLDAIKPMLESIKPEPEDDPPSWMNHIKVIDCASVKPQEEYSHSDVFAAGKPEPENFLEILKIREERRLQKLDDSVYSPVNKHVPLVSKQEALEPSRWACVTPHMCSVCWVNDHMYCSNMRRTSRDLPPHGGCLHYIPCEHYQRETISKALAKQRQEKHLIRAVISDVPVIRVQKVDETPNQDDVDIVGVDEVGQSCDIDLGCGEDMHSSDSEYSPPAGTEVLQTHLKARGEQIRRSLGLPKHQPLPRENGLVSFTSSSPPDSPTSGRVLWSAHGAEIIVASENTWYYPPKHLNILYRDDKDTMPYAMDSASRKLLIKKRILSMKRPDKKEASNATTTRVHIKVVPAESKEEDESSDAPNIGKEVQNMNTKHAGVEIVRIQSLSCDKVSIQHLWGEGNEELVTREEEVNLKDLPANESDRKGEKLLRMGDIIAKEGLKLVCFDQCPDLVSQTLSVMTTHKGAMIKVKNEKVTDRKSKKRRVIGRKDYIHIGGHPVSVLPDRKNLEPRVSWEVQNVECNSEHWPDVQTVMHTIIDKVNGFYGRQEITDMRGSEVDQQRQERDKKLASCMPHLSKVIKPQEEDPIEAANKILEEIKWLKQQRLQQVHQGEEEVEESDEEGHREEITKSDSVVAALVSAANSLAASQDDNTAKHSVSPIGDIKDWSNSEPVVEPGSTSPHTDQSSGPGLDKPVTDQPQECVSEVDASKSEQPDTGDVSSQTLTFSTKDIREKRPHLIDYIKKASLAPVICNKLMAEKSSLENVLGKVDSLFTKLKAELEQKKCLLAAVRSEKYWLEDRQRSFSDKIMTAVDHSVEVTRHLKSMQRSKNKMQLSVEQCGEILSIVQTIQNDKGEVDPRKTDPKLRPFCVNKDKWGKKSVWILNESGAYVKLGSSSSNTRHQGMEGSSTQQEGGSVSVNWPAAIEEQSDSSDRSSVESSESSRQQQDSRKRKPTVRQLLETKRRRSLDSPSSDTPNATSNPSSKSVLIRPVAKLSETRTSEAQDVKTIYISAKSSKPKSSVTISKKLGNANIQSQMPVVIPHKQNREFLSSLINSDSGEATVKVLEKIKDTACKQTPVFSVDKKQSAQIECSQDKLHSNGATDCQIHQLEVPVTSIQQETPKTKSVPNAKKINLKPSIGKHSPAPKQILSGTATSENVSVNPSTSHKSKLSTAAVEAQGSNEIKVRSLFFPSSKKNSARSQQNHLFGSDLSQAIIVTSIPEGTQNFCHEVSKHCSNGTKITVQSKPISLLSAHSPALSSSSTSDR